MAASFESIDKVRELHSEPESVDYFEVMNNVQQVISLPGSTSETCLPQLELAIAQEPPGQNDKQNTGAKITALLPETRDKVRDSIYAYKYSNKGDLDIDIRPVNKRINAGKTALIDLSLMAYDAGGMDNVKQTLEKLSTPGLKLEVRAKVPDEDGTVSIVVSTENEVVFNWDFHPKRVVRVFEQHIRP